MPPVPPRLDDVARRAGVSTATVSRYFNTPRLVAEATAARVRAAVAETGYLPDLTAGALASRRSRLIAALVPDIAQSIFNDTIEGMITALSAEGHGVMLSLTGPDNHRLRREIEMALGRRPDAIVLTGIVSDPGTREWLRGRGVTVVETWALPDDPIDVAVGFSHRASGEALADHLYGRGYRRPHQVIPGSPRARQRAEGFAARWMAAGGDAPTSAEVAVPSHFGQGRTAFRALLELPRRPDVAVCGSDWIAQGLVLEAQATGMRVPRDLAVTGFGNLRMAGDMRPSLTSVDVDGRRIAQEVMTVLRARAAGEDFARRIDVGFRVIARDSA